MLDALDICSALFWQIDHESVTDLRFARSILEAVEMRRVRVFPNHRTAWHFDDKVAQKYALEAVRAPTPTTWVFIDQASALDFLEGARFPLVFKLRIGAASLNVQLMRDRRHGERLVGQMFAGRGGPGFSDRGLRGCERTIEVRGMVAHGFGCERFGRRAAAWSSSEVVG